MPAAEPPEFDAEVARRRAGVGALLMAARTGAQQLLVLAGSVVLYRLLEPSDFGLFAILQFTLTALALFGDAGLGAALIQQARTPTATELSTLWYLQLALSGAVALAIATVAPLVLRFWPEVPPSHAALLAALGLTLVLTSLRSLPVVLLERDLRYGRLALLDVLSTLTYQGAAVGLAVAGHGVASLVWALVAQSAVAAVVAFLLRPVRPALAFDWTAVRAQVRFGVAFQGKTLTGLLGGAALPLVAGKLLPARELGWLTWGQTTALFPMQAVNIVSRVTFPLYSRLQGSPELIARTAERAVQVSAVVTLAFVAVVFGLGSELVPIVFSRKWEPALPVLQVYAAGVSVGFLLPVLSPLLDGTGKVATTLRLSVASTALFWVLAPLGTVYRGALGFAAASAITMWVGNLATVLAVRALHPTVRLLAQLGWPALAAVAAAALGRFVVAPWVQGPWSLLGAVLAVVATFAVVLIAADHRSLSASLRWLRSRGAA